MARTKLTATISNGRAPVPLALAPPQTAASNGLGVDTETLEATKVLSWRYQFQHVLLCGDKLLTKNIQTLDALLSEIEETKMRQDWLEISQLHEVLRRIAFLPLTESSATYREDKFKIVARSSALINKWISQDLLRSPVQVSPSMQALKSMGEQGGVPSAHGARLPLDLPPELLMQIFKLQLTLHTPKLVRKFGTDRDAALWKREINILRSYCLVSKSWSRVAMNILYRGEIFIQSNDQLNKFIRTVRDNIEISLLIQHLHLSNIYFHDTAQRTLFQKSVVRLLPLCSELRYLEATFDALAFDPAMTTVLPLFQDLQELKLGNQSLRKIAPFLSRLPNLKLLLSLYFITNPHSIHNGVFDPVEDIPKPTFTLRDLHLSQSDLSLAQCSWLLSSSASSLVYVELQESRTCAEPLGDILGASLPSLHLKGMMDAPQIGDPDLAATIPRFKNLQSLRVSGRDWPWGTMLPNIQASLSAFAVSYSQSGVQSLVRALDDHTWQRSLRTVTVYHWTDTDAFYGVRQADVKAAKETIESACSRREIRLIWVTEGKIRDESMPYLGITESDLIG